jgi:hypothetical protein
VDQYKFRMWNLVMTIFCSVSTGVTCLVHHACFVLRYWAQCYRMIRTPSLARAVLFRSVSFRLESARTWVVRVRVRGILCRPFTRHCILSMFKLTQTHICSSAWTRDPLRVSYSTKASSASIVNVTLHDAICTRAWSSRV